ncbi:MAG: biotin/lipoyl-containing protein [Vicinamibacterales bacterium]
MKLDVDVGGRVHSVSIESGEDSLFVEVDGERYAVDAARLDPTTLSLVVRGETDRSYEVGFAERATPGEFEVYLRAGVVYTRIHAKTPVRVRRSTGADPFAEESSVVHVLAPMPGRVVRVLVRPGDLVAARQALVVIEAMKMENELRAPRAGRVAEVLAEPGASVDSGRLLVVLE